VNSHNKTASDIGGKPPARLAAYKTVEKRMPAEAITTEVASGKMRGLELDGSTQEAKRKTNNHAFVVELELDEEEEEDEDERLHHVPETSNFTPDAEELE